MEKITNIDILKEVGYIKNNFLPMKERRKKVNTWKYMLRKGDRFYDWTGHFSSPDKAVEWWKKYNNGKDLVLFKNNKIV